MADRPEFQPVFTEDEAVIRNRILGRISDEWRKDPGDFIYDTVAAVPLEVQQGQITQDTILKNGFALYAEGEYLDMKMSEVGLTRNPATKATRKLGIVADAGVVIPRDQVASTVILDEGGNPLEFVATANTTFTAAGQLTVTFTAAEAGALYNIPTGSQFILLPPIPGVRSVVDEGIGVPGADQESDQNAYDRYQFKVRNPDTGGNKNDYVRWSQEVPGVGKARCIQRWNGNGTVKVVLVGTDNRPAAPAIVDAVQLHLDPMLNTSLAAGLMTPHGPGASIVNGVANLAFDAVEEGSVTYGDQTEDLIQTENHFIAKIHVKANFAGTAQDVVGTFSIRDRGTKVPLKQTSTSTLDAYMELKPEFLTTEYQLFSLPFYWDGLQPIEVAVTRVPGFPDYTIMVDRIDFDSVYGQALGEGKAPGSHRVTAKAADNLSINITANVQYMTGADPAQVKAEFEKAVDEYLAGLVFEDAPVIWARIGSVLIGTPGVANYNSLEVNGGTADIAVGTEEVATRGTVTI